MSNEITNADIKELVELAVHSGVAEIEVQRGHNRVRIRRTVPEVFPQQHLQPAVVPAAAPEPSGSAAPPPPVAPSSSDVIVKSPIVGTYYESPKPGDPSFVKVGDHVEPGQVLCIIESMKLMNEIESEVAGTIVAKLMENGRAVEYGEALFTIRPR
ncbi:MAG TPA: acetyl-CoA carboxylase biotin carboxyl carrier protein [Bryobacteraceae bacterium]|nr:acetyl-CoA carboxylase biotin carboxyl carrier protein [Bryobacteraceae bacterium]